MRVQRYLGRTNQEVVNKVKDGLGDDAIIISTRKIRQKGLKGLFTKPLIEIVAAADRSDQTSKKHIDRVEPMGISVNRDLPAPYDNFFERLVEKEVQKDIALDLIRQSQLNNQLQAKREPLTLLRATIDSYIGRPHPIPVDLDRQIRVLFIGPTGVGKTTTLAKLAAKYSIVHGYDVGLVTADTYRIGAANQLEIYSNILDIPLEIIYSPREIIEPLERFQDKDIIFIDTAGKSIKDEDQPEEISTLLQLSEANEIFLCISASTSYQACNNIIKSYDFIEEYKIIYTKADEVTSYGNILNCCYLSRRPISYMTTGQSVPDDIIVLEPSIIRDDLLVL